MKKMRKRINEKMSWGKQREWNSVDKEENEEKGKKKEGKEGKQTEGE